ELQAISKEFPFVEWGILHSSRRSGPRYPSFAWCQKLQMNSNGLVFSAHLEWDFLVQMASIAGVSFNSQRFHRIQLNILDRHSEFLFSIWPKIRHSLAGPELIIQSASLSNDVKALAKEISANQRVSILFDASAGRGILPSQWITPSTTLDFGLAGGLSPANLGVELQKISKSVGDQTIWIDMESGVRTSDGSSLDLSKVRACMIYSSSYVEKEA
ncbi:MAG: hypothetical protein AAFU84_15035, partial [Cyanobacteria bacterium J06633_23]